MLIRTDIAVEARELSEREGREIRGVRVKKTTNGALRKTVVDILDEEGQRTIGKAVGRYVTIESPRLRYGCDDYEQTCKMTADELKAMCRGAKSALVVGLGNREITSDALGPAVVSQLIITSHIKRHMPEETDSSMASVSAIAPGVMGTTGIETLDIIKGIAQKLCPEVIIAVDALAGADLSRVCSTIQLADTGIAPGSGIGNTREGLNRETLGIPVIAIGVPTVIAAELLTGAELTNDFAPLMVTTKDIDNVIRRMSRTVANGINLALHEDMSLKEIEYITNR